MRQEWLPVDTQVHCQTPVQLERVVEKRVDDVEAGILELTRSLDELAEPAEQEVGHVITGVGGGLCEIEASLRPEIVDDVAARVVILAAESDVVAAHGPRRRVPELRFFSLTSRRSPST